MKILILAKKSKPYVKEIVEIAKANFKSVEFLNVEKKNFNFKGLYNKKFDYILSYINDKVVPKKILDNTKIFNINFHPGSLSYPGFGCFNFALYENAKFYGCTVHIMNEKVDTGKIIKVSKFKINKNESVLSLSMRSYRNMYFQFKTIINMIKKNKITF